MAATVMTMETAMAKATLDNVGLRDPFRPPTTRFKFSDLGRITLHFNWAAYSKGAEQFSTAGSQRGPARSSGRK